MRVAAVVQARMGSTRFPGKVLAQLAGKPVLWHVVRRLQRCETVDAVAVATSDGPGDDPIAAFCEAHGVACVRGPEDDVLRRYEMAAKRLDPEIIVRVTGDAPLIDPGTIDAVVTVLVESGAGFCTGEEGAASIHEGFDPFSRAALRKLVREAGDDPVAREHVTGYFKANPGFVQMVRVATDPAFAMGGVRISVDTPADLRFLETLYARLGAPAGEIDLAAVVELLKTHPELTRINAGVHQKTAQEPTRRVLLRCDGDGQLGLGHVSRCLAVAEQLRSRHGLGIVFAMVRGAEGFARVERAGFRLEVCPEGVSEARWLEDLARGYDPAAAVFDVRTDLDRSVLSRLRSRGAVTATIDDGSPRRLEADLTFSPPTPQFRDLDWSDARARPLAGWDWVILDPAFARAARPGDNPVPRVLITMGGSDPAGMTLKAVRAVARVVHPCHVSVLLGPGFSHRRALDALTEELVRPYEILCDPDDLPALFCRTDLAVASFGVTAYELAACGVPSVLLGLTDDHVASASALKRAGAALCLGRHDAVDDETLIRTVDGLLADPARRSRMGRRAAGQVDGLGARRVADRIVEQVREAAR